MLRRIIAFAGILLTLGAAGVAYWRYAEQQAAGAGLLRASGMLEATEVGLSSEAGGRLLRRPVAEGDRIAADAVVAVLDTDLLDHQLRTAPDPATRRHLQQLRDRQTLRSPIDGWVARTVFEPGEQVPPGAPVVQVADWTVLTLKVYLPEHQFGRLMVGQGAAIGVDAYPGVAFGGEVVAIGSEAEFTPRNVQTQEDRVKSVYAIKLRVPNGDLRLKPGMFADATFAVEPSRDGRDGSH